MELTDRHLEMIRETVRQVDYGSVTINISANSNKLDLSVQKRLRFDDEPGVVTMGMDVQKDNIVCEVTRHRANIKLKTVKTT